MSDDAAGAPLTRGQVRMAYRLILGREPENAAVLDAHIARHADLASLREGFLASAEFKRSRGSSDVEGDRLAKGYWAEAGPVDYLASADVAERLAARIREQWTKLGEEEPYWSVLTDDSYRRDRIADTIDRFHQSGRTSARLIDLSAQRTGLAPPRGTCVELGCGVGRITRHLADRFDRVIAVDISPGNMAICRRYLAEQGVDNVETVLIGAIDDLAALPAFDYFYSMIVLQHNPPPIQHRMLSILFGKLRPGGQCLFQTVSDLPGYSFEAESYLASPSPTMEVHSLPTPAITALMREHGLSLDLVRADPWVGAYGSYTYAAHRPR